MVSVHGFPHKESQNHVEAGLQKQLRKKKKKKRSKKSGTLCKAEPEEAETTSAILETPKTELWHDGEKVEDGEPGIDVEPAELVDPGELEDFDEDCEEEALATAEEPRPLWRLAPATEERPPGKKPCDFWGWGSQSCRYGDDCKFWHEPGKEGHNSAAHRSKLACRLHWTKKGCRKGDVLQPPLNHI